MSTRWLAWVTLSRADSAAAFMCHESMDFVLANPGAYATAAHLVPEGIGGYRDSGGGASGEAACGSKVPGDGDDIYMWLPDNEQPRKCKRCARKARS